MFDIQAQAPRNSHSLSRALLPCKGRTPQRVKGTPSKGHNYLKPFIKYPVEVQTEGNSFLDVLWKQEAGFGEPPKTETCPG